MATSWSLDPGAMLHMMLQMPIVVDDIEIVTIQAK